MRSSEDMKQLGRAVLLLLGAGVVLAFPYGPLFPWSPVHPGYQLFSSARADVYYPAGTELESAYREVDRHVAWAEEFHRLKLPRRVTVIACRNWGDFQRFLPVGLGRGVGAATLETGTVIYVTPKLDERGFDKNEFLRHELSHAILNQNAGLRNSHRMGPQAWFYEGIAVACGQQKAYLTREEFEARARTTDLRTVIGPELAELPKPGDFRFFYVAWRYFLEDQVRREGRDRFQGLIDGFLKRPREIRAVFHEVYGEPLERAVERFQASVPGS